MALELLTHRETHKDNTTNCCSQFPQACAVMARLLDGTHSIRTRLTENTPTFQILVGNLSGTFKMLKYSVKGRLMSHCCGIVAD